MIACTPAGAELRAIGIALAGWPAQIVVVQHLVNNPQIDLAFSIRPTSRAFGFFALGGTEPVLEII